MSGRGTPPSGLSTVTTSLTPGTDCSPSAWRATSPPRLWPTMAIRSTSQAPLSAASVSRKIRLLTSMSCAVSDGRYADGVASQPLKVVPVKLYWHERDVRVACGEGGLQRREHELGAGQVTPVATQEHYREWAGARLWGSGARDRAASGARVGGRCRGRVPWSSVAGGADLVGNLACRPSAVGRLTDGRVLGRGRWGQARHYREQGQAPQPDCPPAAARLGPMFRELQDEIPVGSRAAAGQHTQRVSDIRRNAVSAE